MKYHHHNRDEERICEEGKEIWLNLGKYGRVTRESRFMRNDIVLKDFALFLERGTQRPQKGNKSKQRIQQHRPKKKSNIPNSLANHLIATLPSQRLLVAPM